MKVCTLLHPLNRPSAPFLNYFLGEHSTCLVDIHSYSFTDLQKAWHVVSGCWLLLPIHLSVAKRGTYLCGTDELLECHCAVRPIGECHLSSAALGRSPLSGCLVASGHNLPSAADEGWHPEIGIQHSGTPAVCNSCTEVSIPYCNSYIIFLARRNSFTLPSVAPFEGPHGILLPLRWASTHLHCCRTTQGFMPVLPTSCPLNDRPDMQQQWD